MPTAFGMSVPARTPRARATRALAALAALSALAVLPSNAFARIVAATNFESTGSTPDVVWTPELALGTGVPASAASYAAINNNGGVDTRTNTGAKPVPVGAKSKSMSLNADFSGVSAGATSWTALMRTPILSISNTETDLSRLTLNFELSANRVCPVRVRIESFDTNFAGTGSREATILPVAVNAPYRYSLDLSSMTAGSPAFVPTGTGGARFRVSFILTGSATDARSWPRGTGATYNQVYVDNLSYTAPRYFVSQAGGGNGATASTPAALADILKIAQPGDVICANPGTYTGTYEFDRVSGTPSRWITLRPAQLANPPVFRSNAWNAIKVFANASYIDIRGLVVRGYLNDSAQISAGLTLANATADGARIHNFAGQETNPAYAIFPGDPFSRPSNLYFGAGKFNVNGIFLEGRKKKVLSGTNWVEQDTTASEAIHHVRVADCVVYENTGGGVVAAKGDYFTFENNVVYDNNRYSRYGGSGISSLEANDFDGGNGYKIYVVGNISHRNGGDVRWGPRVGTDTAGNRTVTINFSDGNGIIIDTHNRFAYSGRSLVQNNLVYDNGGSGIHALKSDRVDIVNNTAFRNSRPNDAPATVISRRWVQQGATRNTAPYADFLDQPPSWYTDGGESIRYGQIFAQQLGSDVRIRNNILWARAGETTNIGMPAGATNISYDNNLFGRDGSSAAGGTSTTGFTSFNNNVIITTGLASDVFANTTAPGTTSTYLHLKSGSPAANAASIWHPGAPRDDLDGQPRPLGANPDMGAFEDF